MRVCGIIAEYNPFHNGHAYQIQQARERATHIVAVMGGHFMQRGDIACLSKWNRAKAALMNGADLVIELPTVYACASAERFATGGIHILNALGCVDLVHFGSESGDIQALSDCAEKCLHIDHSDAMTSMLKKGYSYPKARQLALGEHGLLLLHPNNTLGIEYIKASKKSNAPFVFDTVSRIGTAHDSVCTTQSMASASHLRTLLHTDSDQLHPFVPNSALDCYDFGGMAQIERLELALLYRLRSLSRSAFKELPDVTEGLENRLFEAARVAISVEQFLEQVKTKRYTMSRLRRILCATLIGIQKSDYETLPQYARVLGCNQKGKEILAVARKTAQIPVSPNFAKLSKQFPRQTQLDACATDLFYLATPQIQRCGVDYLARPIIL